MTRQDKIIAQAKLNCHDTSGKLVKDETWLEWLDIAVAELNLEFKFNFKTMTLTISNYQTNLPDDFLSVKSVYVGLVPAEKTSYDDVRINRGRGKYLYAIEGKKIYTNFTDRDIELVYYGSNVSIDDIPVYYDPLIIDYLTWYFFKCFYPEVEETYKQILERRKFELKANILYLETND
jgi:hypothetical protein